MTPIADSTTPEPTRFPARGPAFEGSLFEGLWVALATPFEAGGGLDLAAYRRLIRHVLEGGVQGLVALGSTGEAATLTDDERDRVISACLQAVDELGFRVPVIAGTGSNATARAAALTRRAAELGVQGALVVTPYYNKPNADGMVAHFEAVAGAAPDLPLVIYNVPGRTGINLTPAVLERLWRLPAAVAIKESSGDLAQIDTIARQLPPGKVLLSGDDPCALASVALGARGLVSVMANLVPRETRALLDAALADRFEQARGLHGRLAPLMASLFLESNPVPLKAALRLRGLTGDRVRPPLAAASSETCRRLAADLAAFEGVAA